MSLLHDVPPACRAATAAQHISWAVSIMKDFFFVCTRMAQKHAFFLSCAIKILYCAYKSLCRSNKATHCERIRSSFLPCSSLTRKVTKRREIKFYFHFGVSHKLAGNTRPSSAGIIWCVLANGETTDVRACQLTSSVINHTARGRDLSVLEAQNLVHRVSKTVCFA